MAQRIKTSVTNILEAAQSERLDAFDRFFERSRLRLKGEGKGKVAAWFLGPKAENKKLLQELVLRAIETHSQARHRFHPLDPKAITAADKKSHAYKNAVKALNKHSEDLFEALQLSAPIWSMRHQGHMLWDQVLPAVVGYFAAMLYNQNNVAAEASPLTTELEIDVGNDLCRLLGFKVPQTPVRGEPVLQTPVIDEPVPWGHIACDGSVANIEGLWAARNAKFFPIALRAALCGAPALESAKGLEVNCPSGARARLIDLDVWTLLNLDIDESVNLPQRICKSFHISTEATTNALRPYAVQNIGLIDFKRQFMRDLKPPVAIAPATCHYSWPKAGSLLGLGQNNILRVEVDLQARMKVDFLRTLLTGCLRDCIPVIAVVAVIGSTEESAVDPLCEILNVRNEFRAKGLNFAVHCDAAWGGYFASLLHEGMTSNGRHRRRELSKTALDVPRLALSPYVSKQLTALREADTVTIDPHKAGYVPYPAGALCYRNSAMRDLISLKAPVVFHSQSEQTVGIYGVEGSKPGAAAAGVHLAHKVIRPDMKGYGKILGECLWTSTRLYCRLVTMDDPCFKIVLLQMLPSERDNEGQTAVDKQRKYIRKHFVDTNNVRLLRLLRKDAKARDLFGKLGSDLVILAYSFNYFTASGQLNCDPRKFAELNSEIFKICSITRPVSNLSSKSLILTSSSFTVADYGRDFVEHYCRRLGVQLQNEIPVPFLISTTMDPWTTDTTKGDFLVTVEKALRGAVHRAIKKVDPDPALRRRASSCQHRPS
jgi:glutamate/tyrosine decarboxylase-like PLP-dependent enzyme